MVFPCSVIMSSIVFMLPRRIYAVSLYFYARIWSIMLETYLGYPCCKIFKHNLKDDLVCMILKVLFLATFFAISTWWVEMQGIDAGKFQISDFPSRRNCFEKWTTSTALWLGVLWIILCFFFWYLFYQRIVQPWFLSDWCLSFLRNWEALFS